MSPLSMKVSVPRQEQIAFFLGSPTAWAEHQGKVYFIRFEAQSDRLPTSPVVKLIQYIFDQFVDHSFFILRNRIFSTEALSPMCTGMVDLAAKRATGSIAKVDHGISLKDLEFVELKGPDLVTSVHQEKINWEAPQKIKDSAEADAALKELLSKIPRGEVLHDFNREIAAILCAADGTVVAWSTNSNSKNKTLHAEVLLLQSVRSLPTGGTLYISLKPCRMCANMIAHLLGADASKANFKVIYFTDDPGPKARGSELEKFGLMELVQG